MRCPVLLAALVPVAALAAEPLCAPLAPASPPAVTLAQAAPATPPPASPAFASASLLADLAALPFVRHLAASGASLRDLGEAHGMRAVAARQGDEFMLFQVAPGGAAAVAGAVTTLSPEQLAGIAPGGAIELAPLHGLRGLFVRSGAHFQVFYVTTDGQRVIPGVLFDADGRELTRGQVAAIPGAVPTVVVGEGAPGPATARPAAAPVPALPLVQRAHAGPVGAAEAPVLWMLADPRCAYSVRALQGLQPFVAAGRVRLAVVPVAVLDPSEGGPSARAAMAMLAQPAEGMVAAWQAGTLAGAVTPEAAARLRENMAVAGAIGLRGTPTFVWRRADGMEGRADGLPDDLGALVAALGR